MSIFESKAEQKPTVAKATGEVAAPYYVPYPPGYELQVRPFQTPAEKRCDDYGDSGMNVENRGPRLKGHHY